MLRPAVDARRHRRRGGESLVTFLFQPNDGADEIDRGGKIIVDGINNARKEATQAGTESYKWREETYSEWDKQRQGHR